MFFVARVVFSWFLKLVGGFTYFDLLHHYCGIVGAYRG